MATDILTADRAKEFLDYCRETGSFTWKKSTGRKAKVGNKAGRSITSDGYYRIGICGKVYRAHRVAFLIEYGRWPTGDVDHIDGNRLNNAISNLRETDRSGNMQNLKRARKDSGTKVLGVSAMGDRFRASIKVNQKQIHLGCFATAGEAHDAYLKAKRELHENCTI